MGHYFENEKLDSKMELINVSIFDYAFKFNTDKGVFSKDKLDYGTRLLLETIYPLDIEGDVLDVGCGYGVISIILSLVTNSLVDGIDVNKRALHLSRINKKLNNSINTNFFESNVYSNVEKKYDFIITNPPIRAGKSVVYDILGNAKDHLKEDGRLFFVMRKSHGVLSAIKFLEKFYNVEIITKNKGFYVIKCKINCNKDQIGV